MDKVVFHSKKIIIGVAGGLVVLLGLVLVPYPGPGWLIVFAGLAILSTEFKFASRVLKYARGKYDAWANWLRNQPWPLRVLIIALTGLFILVTLWLLNTFGMIAGLLNLQYDWLTSPLFG